MSWHLGDFESISSPEVYGEREIDGERDTPELDGERERRQKERETTVTRRWERDDGDSGRGRETDGGEEDKVRVLLSFAH